MDWLLMMDISEINCHSQNLQLLYLNEKGPFSGHLFML